MYSSNDASFQVMPELLFAIIETFNHAGLATVEPIENRTDLVGGVFADAVARRAFSERSFTGRKVLRLDRARRCGDGKTCNQETSHGYLLVLVMVSSSSGAPLFVIVVLPGRGEMPGQPDQSGQAEKHPAERRRDHHVSAVHMNLLFDHDPTRLKQRECDQTNSCGCCDEERIVDFPAKQNRKRNDADE